jgi:hypothetical protein
MCRKSVVRYEPGSVGFCTGSGRRDMNRRAGHR